MTSNMFGGVLPKPLSKGEVYECFKKFKQGDLSAREQIIKCNIRLVISEVSKKFTNIGYEEEELLSIGLIGLIKSVDTFDIDKNFEFATYATRCIDNEILMFMRKGKKYINDRSLNDIIRLNDSSNSLELEDLISDSSIDIELDHEKKETLAILRYIMADLPPREKMIIMLHFGFIDDKLYTQREIAKKLNISQPQISRLIKKTLNTIKQMLISDDISVCINESNNNDITSGVGEECMSKNLKSIYEYFNNYSEEEIDIMISKLTDEEQELIRLRYGNDLHVPKTAESWSKRDTDAFYGSLVPKMKRLLVNPMGKRKMGVKNDESIDKLSQGYHKEDSSVADLKSVDESQETFISVSQLERFIDIMQTPILDDIIKKLSRKESVIACLIFGYVDNKYFSIESVSQFLSVSEEEIMNISKKVLVSYKAEVNKSIDQVVDMVGKTKIKKI